MLRSGVKKSKKWIGLLVFYYLKNNVDIIPKFCDQVILVCIIKAKYYSFDKNTNLAEYLSIFPFNKKLRENNILFSQKIKLHPFPDLLLKERAFYLYYLKIL